MKQPKIVFDKPIELKQPEDPVISVTEAESLYQSEEVTKLQNDFEEVEQVHSQDEIIHTQYANSTPYKGIELQSKTEGLIGNLSFMEGTPWIVEYYQQYLGPDNEPAAYSRDRLNPYQQYRRIKQFELRLTSTLSFSYDEEQALDELTGNAYIIPVIKPNVGDMFIADIGDGRSGLLEINKVRKLSHRKFSAYEVEFFVRDYLHETDHQNLMMKSVDTVLFDKARLLNGSDPFIDEIMLKQLSEIEQWHDRLVHFYFKQFFDDDSSTFLVPLYPSSRVVDIAQLRFIRGLVDSYHFPKYRNLRVPIAEYDNQKQEMTIWDALMQQDWYLLDESLTKFNLVSSASYRSLSKLQFNAWGGTVDYFIHQSDKIPGTLLTHHPMFTARAEMPIFIHEETKSGNRAYIYPIGQYNDYVFSHWFYCNEKEPMSRLERQVHNYLSKEPVDANEILRLTQASLRWDDLERYYYIPVLILLIKAILDGTAQLPREQSTLRMEGRACHAC